MIEKSIPHWIPFTFTTFLNDEKLAYYASTPHVLPKNILPVARNNPALVDISLRIRNPMIRSHSLRWRYNRLLANYRCQCGGPLNRSHFLTCFSLSAQIGHFGLESHREFLYAVPRRRDTGNTVIQLIPSVTMAYPLSIMLCKETIGFKSFTSLGDLADVLKP